MMMNKCIPKLMCVAMTLIMICLFSTTAYAVSTSDAKEAIDITKRCSLTLSYSSEGTAFDGENIKLYKVADVSESFEYTLCGDFSNYAVDLNGASSIKEWKILTETLNGYIVADNLKPFTTGVTNENGVVEFSDLSCGMYLVLGFKTTENDYNYTFESFMVSVPYLNENGVWSYDVASNPKSETSLINSGTANNEKKYTVVKIWQDSANRDKRPDSVKVEVLKDGVSQSIQTLNSKNNWSYSWSAADDGSIWTVVERDVPDGYTVNVSKSIETFSVVNTYPGSSDNPKTGDDSQMALYLVLLCASGAVLIVLGFIIKKKSSNNN